MLQRLTQFWWLLILRGVISIVFAIIAFTNPKLAFQALILVLGVFLLADGFTAMYLGFRMRGYDDDWWAILLEGALGAGLGLIALINPEMTAEGLVLVLAVWFLVTGFFEIVTAIKLRKEIEHEWLLGFAGLISMGLGILMMINPNAGAISIMWWLGIYAAVFGLLLLVLGFRMWHLHRKWSEV
ncbi:MAG: HdeD family acid-resistance protein [Haliscomenobacteraceae bacterium CHB4]|nr:hypothetical protein [Saprospiraceae bacterium]MCE7922295.1 HdeD family acid-resistance protein [Haliscomenobacteraceae bacterium CHB4]